MIREMREKGMSICRWMHMGRNTAKKHLRLDKPLEYRRKGRKSKLAPVRWPRNLLTVHVFTDCLPVNSELFCYCCNTHPFLLHLSYHHPHLITVHNPPPSCEGRWGILNRRFWGILNRRKWGKINRLLHLLEGNISLTSIMKTFSLAFSREGLPASSTSMEEEIVSTIALSSVAIPFNLDL